MKLKQHAFGILLVIAETQLSSAKSLREVQSGAPEFDPTDGTHGDRGRRQLFAGVSTFSDPRTVEEKGQQERMIDTRPLPFCSLEGPTAKHSLAGGKWVDSYRETRPKSWRLGKELEKSLAQDANAAERKERVAHLWYEPIGCRLHDWDAPSFKQCLSSRRLIFVGDSITLQMGSNIFQLMDQGFDLQTFDDPKEGNYHRYLLDPRPSGPPIYVRSMFSSSSDIHQDNHPVKFSIESWEKMVDGIGGWQKGDVLIVNFGAHYLSKEDGLESIQMDFPVLFETLADIPKDDVTIFWREYAPAHFRKTHNGEFPLDKKHIEGLRICGPHRITKPSEVNEIASATIQDCGARCEHIRQIKIWDLMEDAWDQHAESTYRDCRHFLMPGPIEYWNNLLYHQLCFNEE